MKSKIDNKVEKIYQRLAEIEAAVSDVSPSSFGVKKVRELESGGLVETQFKNRLNNAFLLLYHLQDDAKRLAKDKNINKVTVDEFRSNSSWVKLCIRAGDTYKHGLGGRSKNGTLLNGLLYAVKTESHEQPKSEHPKPEYDAILIGMLVADADYGTFPSQILIEGALLEWRDFLNEVLDVDISDWVNRCIPDKSNIVPLQQGKIIEAPLGTTFIFEIPENMRDLVQKQVIKERDEA